MAANKNSIKYILYILLAVAVAVMAMAAPSLLLSIQERGVIGRVHEVRAQESVISAYAESQTFRDRAETYLFREHTELRELTDVDMEMTFAEAAGRAEELAAKAMIFYMYGEDEAIAQIETGGTQGIFHTGVSITPRLYTATLGDVTISYWYMDCVYEGGTLIKRLIAAIDAVTGEPYELRIETGREEHSLHRNAAVRMIAHDISGGSVNEWLYSTGSWLTAELASVLGYGELGFSPYSYMETHPSQDWEATFAFFSMSSRTDIALMLSYDGVEELNKGLMRSTVRVMPMSLERTGEKAG